MAAMVLHKPFVYESVKALVLKISSVWSEKGQSEQKRTIIIDIITANARYEALILQHIVR